MDKLMLSREVTLTERNLGITQMNKSHMPSPDENLNFSGQNQDLLKKNLEHSHNLIDYFISYNVSNLASLLRIYQTQGEKFISKIFDIQDSLGGESEVKNSVIEGDKDSRYMQFNNVAFEVLDRVPSIDRTSLPISQVINIIPRQLFRKERLSLRNIDVESVGIKISHSSIYLPGSDMYAYITGMLFYERIDSIISSDGIHNKHEFEDDGGNNKKLWIPKIIVLVCRRPLFSEMMSCIKLIFQRTLYESNLPLESMVKNLIFETTYITPDYKFSSDFWLMNDLQFNTCKYKYFHHIFMVKQE
jgi:hypothetical protein